MALQPRRCEHCNRAVRSTLHTRDGARVDYYRMFTGETRAEAIEDPKAPGETLRILHVEALREVVTCADCWSRSETHSELERLWAGEA